MKTQKQRSAAAQTLPELSTFQVNAVADWLYGRETMQRKPVNTAKILLLAVKLYKLKSPWPTRPQVAEHCGVSMPLIDSQLSQRRATKMISIQLETTQGHVKARASVIQHRFVEPSDELIEVVEKAERDEKKLKRRKAMTPDQALVEKHPIDD